jgi:SnoaL-like polyketide cyclase
MMQWDDLPDVRSPYGVPIATLLQHGPRRQELPGFEPVYRDFVDYIMRCTHRIWEEKNIGLCRTHYGADVVMHTLAGPAQGAESVVQGTIGALAMSSDRQVIGEDVIWSHDDDDRLYSSHRITSQMTHMAYDAMLGPATFQPIGVTTIADCACRENKIVEEWLVRDNARAVLQVGGDPWAVAQAQAVDDIANDAAAFVWRDIMIEATKAGDSASIAADHPAHLPAQMLQRAFAESLFGDAARALSPTAETRWPTNRVGHGRGYWIGCATQMAAMLHHRSVAIGHAAARPAANGDICVALRWTLCGTHLGNGPWGLPTGREILILGISHYRIRGGAIVEDITVFDELAILRQIAGGLGA